jgi:hypothetical protein
MLPFGVTIPASVPQRPEIPEGLMNYPAFENKKCKCTSDVELTLHFSRFTVLPRTNISRNKYIALVYSYCLYRAVCYVSRCVCSF